MSPQVKPIIPFGVLVEPSGGNKNIRDLSVHFLRELFLEKHLLVLRNFDTFTNSEDFANYCESWGAISIWPFGKVLELIEQKNPQDHIFDNSYVPLHWDGMYRPQVPEYQIFHCVTAPLPGQGGQTTFSNTVSALASVSASTRKLWDRVTGTYKRKMEFYDSQTVSPVITNHPFRNFSVIRYNEAHSEEKGHFNNPPEQDFAGIPALEFEKFHSTLKEALYAPPNFYAHEWQNGDVVIADNFSLLHGREAFASRSPRHIQRVQVLSNPPLANPGLVHHR